MTAWDGVARWYPLQEPAERASWRLALRLALPRPDDVALDLGCGPGTAVRQLRRAGLPRPPGWVGLDASRSMLVRARAAGEPVVVAEVTRLPLAEASADLVVAGWLLHVLSAEARIRCLREVARVLRPDGRCVVMVPAAPTTYLGRVARTVTRRLVGGSGALSVPDDLDDAVTAAGLVIRHDAVTRAGYTARVLLLAPRRGRA